MQGSNKGGATRRGAAERGGATELAGGGSVVELAEGSAACRGAAEGGGAAHRGTTEGGGTGELGEGDNAQWSSGGWRHAVEQWNGGEGRGTGEQEVRAAAA